MTNREKLIKTNIYDLMMTIQDTGCPIWIVTGDAPSCWDNCTEDKEMCTSISASGTRGATSARAIRLHTIRKNRREKLGIGGKTMRLIDGDALKAKFCNHCDERDCKPDATDTVYGCVIADTIDSMPTIEAEPVKHGRWIENSDPGQNINEHYMCSECGCTFHNWANDNYCPNFGVRMDGDNE